ncbi:hypothetical protein AB1Y20_001883 [Prymnesium parvum]|uniref:Uncharacterized protein n=1 Tax=Prymnesium parvum TaxID=97485 RepID=A0AB34J7I1_PRYPA
MERPLLAVAALSVLHALSLALPRLSLGAAAPAGFTFPDLLDAALSLSLCFAHLRLARGASPSEAHSLSCALLALAQGVHLVANPAERLLPADVSPAASLLHWQHEYLSHRLFAIGSLAPWLLLPSPPPPHATLTPFARARLALAALAHGLSFGALSIGARAVPLALPLALLLLAVAPRHKQLHLRWYAAVLAAAIVALHLGWLLRHGASLPTFDEAADPSLVAPFASAAHIWAVPLLLPGLVGATCLLLERLVRADDKED